MAWTPKTKQTAWFAAATIFLAALIILTDINEFLEAAKAADKKLILIALLTGLVPNLVWGNTWHSFLNKVGAGNTYTQNFRLFMAGDFLNKVTPMGQFGGEPAMAYIISRKTDLKYEKAFSAVISSDIINAIPTFTFVAAGATYLFLFGRLTSLITKTLIASGAIFVIGGSFSYLLWFRAGTIEKKVLQVATKISETLNRGEEIVASIESRFEVLEESFETIGNDSRHLLKTSLIAHIYYLFQSLTLYITLLALDIHVNLAAVFFVLPLAAVSNFTPTPGGTGAYEAVMATLLNLFFGISLPVALAASIIFRILTYWSDVVIGYISFISLGGKESI